jgi:hypothetical protein
LGNGFLEITNVVVDTTYRTFSFTSAKSDTTTVTTYKGWDYDNTPAALISILSLGNNYSIDIDCNRYGKYDYVARKNVIGAPASCAGTVSWTTKGRYYWVVKTYLDGVPLTWWRYYDPIIHYISYHSTATAAAAAIAGGNDGSHISSAGDSLWQAHKIVYGTSVHE